MIKIGTDCSGIGAPEQALTELGIEHHNVFACEIDKHARATYLRNHSCAKMFEDITKRPMDGIEQLDLYVAGFPCQAFSIAGHRLGFEDIRGTIFFNCAEFIRINRPRAFVLENVKGLLSHDKAKGSKEKHGRTFKTIINVLSKSINGQPFMPFYTDNLGYNVYYKILDTKKYGIPQTRERIFIVGLRDDEDTFQFPQPVPLKVKLNDILEKAVDEKYYLSDDALLRIQHRMRSEPQVNPAVTGTINTKNNSGQLSTDKGTTLITDEPAEKIIGKVNNNWKQKDMFSSLDANYYKGPDNHGQRSFNETSLPMVEKRVFSLDVDRIVINNKGNWEERKNFHAVLANYGKCFGTTNRAHSFILGYSRCSKTGEVLNYHKKPDDTFNTVTGSSGGGGNTDQFVVEEKPATGDEPLILQREHGHNKGGVFADYSPCITKSSWHNNNHVIEGELKKVATLFDNDAEAGRVYDTNGVSSTVKSSGGGMGGKSGLYMVGSGYVKKRIRRLTPRECFRLQGFPDSFDISGVSDTQLYKMAGNSMTVAVIKGVIKNILCGRKK